MKGNLSWVTLRGRQRREERKLMADALGKGMGAGYQNLCIRRLDLMEQHIRECKEHTIHQLCKLFRLGSYSEAANPRQVDRRSHVSEKDASACTSSHKTYHTGNSADIESSKISFFYLHERMDENSCAAHSSVKEEEDEPTNSSEENKVVLLIAARMIQSAFRG